MLDEIHQRQPCPPAPTSSSTNLRLWTGTLRFNLELGEFSNDLPEVIQRADPASLQAADTMREFMHYITNAFYAATGWNEDNTYQELNATARGTPPASLPAFL